MLTCQKHLFQLPDGEHYLNGAYMSPLLRAAEEAGIEGIRRKRFPVEIGAEDFFDDADEARALFGRLINAGDVRRVAVLPAVSYGIAIAARNVAVERGQTLVVTEGQFPSNVLVWKRLAKERGAELRTVPAPDAGPGRSREWNARVLEALDGRTAAVALPPVHWTDGTRFDLAAIAARARESGAALVVDGTQAVGAMPFDVQAVGADAVICAAYKWLLGPYSVAFGWFGPRFDAGTPLEEAWLARAGSEDFRSLVHYAEEYRAAAARYDVGGRSNFVLLPMAIAGLRQLLEWDVREVEAYCGALTRPLFAELLDAGYALDDDHGRAAHLFGLRVPHGLDTGALKDRLDSRRVHVSLRGTAVRVSPNVYNDESDLGALRDALLEAARAPSGP